MRQRTHTESAKKQTQNAVKIALWAGAFVSLVIIVMQIAYPTTSSSSKERMNSQAELVEAHSAELSEEANKIESTLNEVQFDEDIRALRDQ